jgi:hypothetical protein
VLCVVLLLTLDSYGLVITSRRHHTLAKRVALGVADGQLIKGAGVPYNTMANSLVLCPSPASQVRGCLPPLHAAVVATRLSGACADVQLSGSLHALLRWLLSLPCLVAGEPCAGAAADLPACSGPGGGPGGPATGGRCLRALFPVPHGAAGRCLPGRLLRGLHVQRGRWQCFAGRVAHTGAVGAVASFGACVRRLHRCGVVPALVTHRPFPPLVLQVAGDCCRHVQLSRARGTTVFHAAAYRCLFLTVTFVCPPVVFRADDVTRMMPSLAGASTPAPYVLGSSAGSSGSTAQASKSSVTAKNAARDELKSLVIGSHLQQMGILYGTLQKARQETVRECGPGGALPVFCNAPTDLGVT